MIVKYTLFLLWVVKNPKETTDLNVVPTIEAINSKLNCCFARDLSIYGRVLLSMSPNALVEILSKFICRNRPDKLKRCVL